MTDTAQTETTEQDINEPLVEEVSTEEVSKPVETQTTKPVETTVTVNAKAPTIMNTVSEVKTPEPVVDVRASKRVVVTGKPPVNSAGKSVF